MRSKVRGRFEPLSDLEIEEYLCGNAGDELEARVEAAANASPELRAYLAERRAEQAAFFVQHPALSIRAPARHVRQRTGWLALGVGALGSAVALSGVLLVVSNTDVASVRPQIQTRGGVKALLTVRREGRVFAYRDGIPLRQGDQVRLSIESPAGGFVTVLGPGEEGKLTAYYDAVEASPGTFTVPDSLILDDHAGEEEWLILLAESPLRASDALERLERNEPLAADKTVLRIVKEAP